MIVGAVLALIALIGGLLWRGSYQVLHPFWMKNTRSIDTDPNRALGYYFETVSFSTDGDVALPGWLVPAEDEAASAVVYVHGAGGNRTEGLESLKFLHEAGYPVLMFDCRDQGLAPGNDGISLGVREHRDLEAAVRYMKHEQRFSRVTVFGCSQGGASVIEAAAEDPEIDAAIAEASFAEVDEVVAFNVLQFRHKTSPLLAKLEGKLSAWRVGARGKPGPIDAVARIAPRPILIMQGTADESVPPGDGPALYAAARQPKELWMGEGARHCQLNVKFPQEYQSRVLDFLNRYGR